MSAPLLSVEKVTKRFGGLTAVSGATFTAPKGAITGLIGPNGAGKTTLFAMIAGFERPSDGTVRFRGEDISRLEAHQRAAAGIARTFQIVQPFAGLSVRENIAVGAYLRHAERPGGRAMVLVSLGMLLGLMSKATVLVLPFLLLLLDVWPLRRAERAGGRGC